jgi:DNA primase
MKYLSNNLRKIEQGRGKRKKRAIDWLAQVDVVDFLETLDVVNIHHASKDEWSFSCPFDGHKMGDASPSAYMNDGSINSDKATLWVCFGCGRKGNAIDFLAEHEHISKQDALRQIREHFAPDYRAPKHGSISQEFEERYAKHTEDASEPDTQVIPWEVYDEQFYVDWDSNKLRHPEWFKYMLSRGGFSPHTLNKWKIGYDTLSKRLTIPVCNPKGQLIGVKARRWRSSEIDSAKYKVLGDRPGTTGPYGFPRYEKSRVLFGLHVWLKASKQFVLVEGELDVIALYTIGIPAISTGSSSMSEHQAKLIREYCDQVIIMYDWDTAGINNALGFQDAEGEWHPGVAERLEPFIKVKVVRNHEMDPCSYIENGRKRDLESAIKGAISTTRLQSDFGVL